MISGLVVIVCEDVVCALNACDMGGGAWQGRAGQERGGQGRTENMAKGRQQEDRGGGAQDRA